MLKIAVLLALFRPKRQRMGVQRPIDNIELILWLFVAARRLLRFARKGPAATGPHRLNHVPILLEFLLQLPVLLRELLIVAFLLVKVLRKSMMQLGLREGCGTGVWLVRMGHVCGLGGGVEVVAVAMVIIRPPRGLFERVQARLMHVGFELWEIKQ